MTLLERYFRDVPVMYSIADQQGFTGDEHVTG